MMVRHIRLDRRQFYLFEGLGINSRNDHVWQFTDGDSIPRAETYSSRALKRGL